MADKPHKSKKPKVIKLDDRSTIPPYQAENGEKKNGRKEK